MRVLDASSIVFAWDNYPIAQFPKLWDWLREEVESAALMMLSEVLVETHGVSPECGAWLVAANLTHRNPTNPELRAALAIKARLGIGDRYMGRGVGETDINQIAVAKTIGITLISNESVQLTLPPDPQKYKIPAVCRMPEVGVRCLSFLDYFKEEGVVFA